MVLEVVRVSVCVRVVQLQARADEALFAVQEAVPIGVLSIRRLGAVRVVGVQGVEPGVPELVLQEVREAVSVSVDEIWGGADERLRRVVETVAVGVDARNGPTRGRGDRPLG